MDRMVERFLRYVKIDTASDAESKTYPSTERQIAFGKMLVEEMLNMGLKDAHIDDNGYVIATLPSNISKEVPTIGFIAHMDVVNSVPSANVMPQIIKDYDGGDIVLNEEKSIILSPRDFPSLKDYIGEDIIASDGTTLLGGDDKAGIVEILEAVEYLINNPDVKHGAIKIAFTPDEEIGKGTTYFDVEKFGADFAYTLDGGAVGGIDYENFNAANAKIIINGKNIHPGSAKNQMKNSMLIAMELNAMLPVNERPAHTEKYEGFYHLTSMKGNVEQTTVNYIIRDHHKDRFETKKKHMQRVVEYLNATYDEGTVVLDMKDSYYNMREKIEPVMHIVDTAKQAMRELGIEPVVKPVRGGTDGARLSFIGLPCPNLFTGGHNAHGKFEYIPIGSMEKAVQVILKIIELYSK